MKRAVGGSFITGRAQNIPSNQLINACLPFSFKPELFMAQVSVLGWHDNGAPACRSSPAEGDDGAPTPSEGDPAGVAGGLAAPAGHQHQHAGDGEREHAQQDEEERGDPLGGQLRRDAVAVPAVDGLALLDQAHRQGAWRETQEGWLVGRSREERGVQMIRVRSIAESVSDRCSHAGATFDVTPLSHLLYTLLIKNLPLLFLKVAWLSKKNERSLASYSRKVKLRKKFGQMSWKHFLHQHRTMNLFIS